MGQLSETQIKGIKPGPKEFFLNDGDNLFLRVRDTGKAWIYRYEKGGKTVKLGLGPYPAVTLAQARAKAYEANSLRADGQDLKELRAKYFPKMMSDERSLRVVEELVPLAADAGMPLTHLGLAFVISHPGIASAIIGPSTAEQLEDLLAASGVTLDDALLDRIDELVPPGTDVAPLEGSGYSPPAIAQAALRRRPLEERSAA